MPSKKTCSISDCDKPVKARGWCSMHYDRWSKHGDPLEQRRYFHSSPDEALSRMSAEDPRTGCIVWAGPKTLHGYGRISFRGETIYAHRHSWERVNGPIPDGMHIDHACHNKSCINPEHLRLATRVQNMRNLPGPRTGRVHDLPRNVSLRGSRYSVRLGMGGGKINGGTYATVAEAAEAAARLRDKYYGSYAGNG